MAALYGAANSHTFSTFESRVELPTPRLSEWSQVLCDGHKVGE